MADRPLEGRVTLVNFWATSCTTCVAEMPEIVATYNKFKDKGYDTLAVAMSYDPPAFVARFAETRKLPFGVAMADGKMRWELNMMAVKSTERPKTHRWSLSCCRDGVLARCLPSAAPGFRWPPTQPPGGPQCRRSTKGAVPAHR